MDTEGGKHIDKSTYFEDIGIQSGHHPKVVSIWKGLAMNGIPFLVGSCEKKHHPVFKGLKMMVSSTIFSDVSRGTENKPSFLREFHGKFHCQRFIESWVNDDLTSGCLSSLGFKKQLHLQLVRGPHLCRFFLERILSKMTYPTVDGSEIPNNHLECI